VASDRVTDGNEGTRDQAIGKATTVLLNILALAATVGVAYMSAVQGVYRAVQILIACIVAGTLAFGLCGPLAGIGASNDPTSLWYYAGDAFFLWLVFCLVFMGLRTACDQFLPNQPAFPYYINFPGGGVVGLATGYLCVGLCLVLAQMLPLAPDILGYSPFDYTPAENEAHLDSLNKGEPLWLSWDRGALTFFGYLSAAPLGSEASSFHRRYRDVRYDDVYPPPEFAKLPKTGPVDNVLYYDWYRRYQAVRWRQYWMAGPLPRRVSTAEDKGGLALIADRMRVVDDVDLRVLGVVRRDTLDGFPLVKPPADEDFVLITLLITVDKLPRTVDSADFLLVTNLGEKIHKPPLIYGATKPGEEPTKENIVQPCTAPNVELRGVSFVRGQADKPGHYLADGATFKFTAPPAKPEATPATPAKPGPAKAPAKPPPVRALSTFVFTMPKSKGYETVRLLFEPPAAPPKPEATPATPAKPGPAKAPANP
jgi:hypothetical protein